MVKEGCLLRGAGGVALKIRNLLAGWPIRRLAHPFAPFAKGWGWVGIPETEQQQ